MARVTAGGKTIQVPEGTLLRDALPEGVRLPLPCGGQGRCGKCRVTAAGRLSPPSPEELRLLSREELSAGVRLACRARVLGDCVLTLPEQGESQIQLEADLPPFPLDPVFRRYGAAIDLGTTTLAAQLWDRSGRLLAQASCPNPQSPWGADVISRIQAAMEGQGKALAQAARQGISRLLLELAQGAGIPPDEIDLAAVTGNTAMLTLLTETDPEPLSHAPFAPSRLFGETLPAAALGLPCPQAQVVLSPCVSAFVGGDVTTALLASSLCEGQGTKLLADIGTNGEIALWHEGKLTCASTAAGPAFEGAGLSMGMEGRAGAIAHVRAANGQLWPQVIGGGEPQGLCGSGVIDALACLLELERMDETGLLEEDPAPIAGRVSLSQRDVRMVQLAKSAVCAGLLTLLRREGVSLSQVEELVVAGGFGSYLNVKNAGRVGLLPPELVPRVRVAGNAALAGAGMLLLSRDGLERAKGLAGRAQAEDLSGDPVFAQLYTDNMFF